MLFLVSWSRVLRVLVFAVAASLPLGAAPLVSFNPPLVAVTSGASISVNAVISGLGLPPEVGSFDILALRENLNRWPFYATFRRATNSVFVAARR